jgi:hypothetical protein
MVDGKLKAGSQCAGHCHGPSVALFEAGTAGDSTQLGHTESPSHGLTFHPLSGTTEWDSDVGAQWVAVLCQSRCHVLGKAQAGRAPHTVTRAGSGCQGLSGSVRDHGQGLWIRGQLLDWPGHWQGPVPSPGTITLSISSYMMMCMRPPGPGSDLREMSESANAADKPRGAALPWVANLDGKPVC